MNQNEKPHKGIIKKWSRVWTEEGLGFAVVGVFVGHPHIDGFGHTSWVVKHDKKTGAIETRNSRYTLIDDEMVRLTTEMLRAFHVEDYEEN